MLAVTESNYSSPDIIHLNCKVAVERTVAQEIGSGWQPIQRGGSNLGSDLRNAKVRICRHKGIYGCVSGIFQAEAQRSLIQVDSMCSPLTLVSLCFRARVGLTDPPSMVGDDQIASG